MFFVYKVFQILFLERGLVRKGEFVQVENHAAGVGQAVLRRVGGDGNP